MLIPVHVARDESSLGWGHIVASYSGMKRSRPVASQLTLGGDSAVVGLRWGGAGNDSGATVLELSAPVSRPAPSPNSAALPAIATVRTIHGLVTTGPVNADFTKVCDSVTVKTLTGLVAGNHECNFLPCNYRGIGPASEVASST